MSSYIGSWYWHQPKTHFVQDKSNHLYTFHNSVKQCQILIKLSINSATANCKHQTSVILSMPALVITGLVRSPQNIRCHYSNHAGVMVNVLCVRVCKHKTWLVSVKMPCVCSNASSQTWTPLPDCFMMNIWWKCTHFSIRHIGKLQLIDVINMTAVHTFLQLPQIS